MELKTDRYFIKVNKNIDDFYEAIILGIVFKLSLVDNKVYLFGQDRPIITIGDKSMDGVIVTLDELKNHYDRYRHREEFERLIAKDIENKCLFKIKKTVSVDDKNKVLRMRETIC